MDIFGELYNTGTNTSHGDQIVLIVISGYRKECWTQISMSLNVIIHLSQVGRESLRASPERTCKRERRWKFCLIIFPSASTTQYNLWLRNKRKKQGQMCAKSLGMVWKSMQKIRIPKKVGACTSSRERNVPQCFTCWSKERRQSISVAVETVNGFQIQTSFTDLQNQCEIYTIDLYECIIPTFLLIILIQDNQKLYKFSQEILSVII